MQAQRNTPFALARAEQGVSLAHIARELGYDKGHLSRIERGEVTASPELAKKLALYFEGKVTRDQILFPEEYVAPGKKPARSVRHTA